jgi:hypothetical protein
MVLYFLSVIVVWVPATIAVRRLTGTFAERLIGGLLVATVWPLSLPVLSLSVLRDRVHA